MADDNYSLKDILWEYSDFPPPGQGPAPLAPQAPERSGATPPAGKAPDKKERKPEKGGFLKGLFGGKK